MNILVFDGGIMRAGSMLGAAKSWPILAWFVAILLFLPIVSLFFIAVSGTSNNIQHLYDTVLFHYIGNSLLLLLGVCTMSMVWGVSSAWLVVRYDFPLRRFLRWSLLLPLAMPAYLVAFVYTETLDYAGPIQIMLRSWFGWQNQQDYWFVDMRTMGGAIFVLSLVFSPYLYWLVSLNFTEQSQSLIHAARLLGRSEWQIFWRIVLPLARPAIVVGCTLVGMETLADYGTASYFSIWHITTAVYDTWLQRSDLTAAARLSCLLLLFVVILITLERRGRRKLQLYSGRNSPLLRERLFGIQAYLATTWCLFILFLGFLFPFIWLMLQAVRYFFDTDWAAFARMMIQTLSVASGAAVLVVIVGILLHLYQRISPRNGQWVVRLSSLGYAVPGTVLAIGILIVTTTFDHWVNDIARAVSGRSIGLLFSGTLMALTLAFFCRFSAVGLGAIETGMSKLPRSLDHTAYLYGYTPAETAYKIWLPLLRNSILTGFLLVFLECIKELSAALLLRPFNVQMLSTYVYEYMSAELFEVAALPAILIVFAGLPTVLILTAAMREKHE